MTREVRDAQALYRVTSGHDGATELGASLRFDRGTLVLDGVGVLPPGCADYFAYDPRIDKFRAPAYRYARIIPGLRAYLQRNQAPAYGQLDLVSSLDMQPYAHQREALAQWQTALGCGLVVLPTGAGKTLVGLLALRWARRATLVVVPTLDLMQQWYALLRAAFPEQAIGLIGGGYHEVLPIAVATYDSAARHADRLGNRYGLLIFDEAHHLPAEFYRCIAEFSLAPYRLGLSATPTRSDGGHEALLDLIGPTVYQKQPRDLAGDVLAPFALRTWQVDLSAAEREAYRHALDERNLFLEANHIKLGSLTGWNRFVIASAKSAAGRRAMQAHQQARRIAQATPAKLRALAAILASHYQARIIVFTEDNASAYEVSQRFLIPCITHQTKIKERQEILESFKAGIYSAVVTSKVLNEGVDIPDAAIGVVLSGSASGREFVQRLGRILRRAPDKQAILYEVVARDTREERVSERRREPLVESGHDLKPPEQSELPLFRDA